MNPLKKLWNNRVENKFGVEELHLFETFSPKLRNRYIAYSTKLIKNNREMMSPTAYKELSIAGESTTRTTSRTLHKDFEEISIKLGIPKKEVKKNYFEALAKIKKYVETRQDLKDSLLEYYLENNF